MGGGREYKLGNKTNPDRMAQHKYNEPSKSDKVISGIIPIPDAIIADASTATKVGKGNLCRILGTAAGYVWFGPDATLAAPGIGDLAIQTTAAWFFTVATDDYIRSSAAMRVEVSKESELS